MEVRLLVIIGWLVVMAAGGIAGSLRAKRRSEMPAIAARAGLQYSATDPFACTRMRFTLFCKGDGRTAENLMWRDADDGHSFRVFDYEYWVEHKDQYGRVDKTYHRSSCAMALVGSAWPDITIGREGAVDKIINAVAGGDIDFESEEFNRLFAVHCADRRFASALIDAQMLDFLLSTKGELDFELKGRWLLVWTSPVAPKLMPGLLRMAEEFVRHIPPVVWELYPSTFVDEVGRPLPPGDDPVDRMKAELELADLHARHGDDPWATLAQSPYEALEREDGVEYDLDGHVLPKVEENPWGTGRAPHSPP
jgi:hypothetical protein